MFIFPRVPELDTTSDKSLSFRGILLSLLTRQIVVCHLLFIFFLLNVAFMNVMGLMEEI